MAARDSVVVDVEALRRAASDLRSEWGGPRPMGTAWHRERDFHLAVAGQLDAMAAVVDEAIGSPLEIVAVGLAKESISVARAYLGEPA